MGGGFFLFGLVGRGGGREQGKGEGGFAFLVGISGFGVGCLGVFSSSSSSSLRVGKGWDKGGGGVAFGWRRIVMVPPCFSRFFSHALRF